LSNYGCDSAQERSDQLILLPVLHDIASQQFSSAFVVDLLEEFRYLVTLALILAFIQFLFELLVLLFSCRLIFGLAEVRQFKVKLPLKLVLKNFSIFCLVDVLFHDIFDLDKFLFVVLDGGVVADGVDDDFEVFLGEDKFFLEIVVEGLELAIELAGHPQVFAQLALQFLQFLRVQCGTAKAASNTARQLIT
jgi:hypothetical protein